MSLFYSRVKIADGQQKEHLIKAIDSYLEVRIHLADQVIAETAREKIKPGCSVVAFARSVLLHFSLSNLKVRPNADLLQIISR
jgi:hypothetical protein